MAVARAAGCRTSKLYPGEAKSDTRDTAVTADAARTMPHTPRGIELASPTGCADCSPGSTRTWNAC
ncbi:hypothetical protein GCM10020229_47680 [Kitasatospora albolonga]